jgi:Na+-transporting NADH:ubiquinone oxidoreductase subunit NqrB
LGLSILLKANFWWVYALAAAIAIGSKFIIKYKNKHVFNPANFGIIAVIMLTNQAWISPGQWGSSVYWLFLVGTLGVIVVSKVGRWDTAIAFLGTWVLCCAFRFIGQLHWPADFLIQHCSSGSLLLFSFFMITDPCTTPNHKWVRRIWAICIAGIAFYLQTFYFLNGAAVWVLCAASLLTPILDYLFVSAHFQWQAHSPKTTQISLT